MDSIERHLEKIFEDVLWGETIPTRERTRMNCSGWDSLAQMNLLLAMEQEFQIAFTDDEAVELNSFDSALDLVRSKSHIELRQPDDSNA